MSLNSKPISGRFGAQSAPPQTYLYPKRPPLLQVPPAHPLVESLVESPQPVRKWHSTASCRGPNANPGWGNYRGHTNQPLFQNAQMCGAGYCPPCQSRRRAMLELTESRTACDTLPSMKLTLQPFRLLAAMAFLWKSQSFRSVRLLCCYGLSSRPGSVAQIN